MVVLMARSYNHLTESYNGTSWSELAEINTARTEANRGVEELKLQHY